MCQISSLMAAAEGPVAEFLSFANFEEKKRKSNLLMPFPKTGNHMGSFGHIRKNSFFRFCRPILDIFGFTLLRSQYIAIILNLAKLHVFGEWFDSSQSVYALRDRGALSTITAQE